MRTAIVVIIGAVVLIVSLLYLLPALLFWSIETLFHYHISMTWKTWAAAIFLLGVLTPSSKGK